MSREQIEDLSALAEEHGGRFGVFHVPGQPDEFAHGAIVRVIDDGEEAGTVFCLAITVPGEGEWRLLMRREEFDWILANPAVLEDDDD